ncbi:hypothetical protein P7L79_11255 [Tistrella mobilis]|uniref:hypothetical protein n=1 Tax=Tistrella mobilis TaxID=171437 RepID=UPI003557E475
MKTARFVACALPLLCSSAALAQTITYEPAGTSTAVTLPPLQADSLSPTPPADVNGGAAQANLVDAAYFAWQEFIALNWPALKQNGQVVRDTPDPSATFGDPNAGPLVWETYRHKIEIFPGSNSPNDPPHGVPPGSNDPWGYSTPPSYVYSPAIFGADGQVPACPGQPAVAQPAWINLDETSQIGLATMHAGILDGTPPASPNSAPSLIRYLAKANQSEFDYVVSNRLWYVGTDGTTPLEQRIATWKAGLAAGKPAPENQVVTLPAGTIEVKSAWRPLVAGKEDPTRYHTNTVRYYEPGPNGNPCWWEAKWALVALHIIQKTPSAPHFIFATFEQADNILQPDGTPIEDASGNIVQPPVGATPTTPYLAYQDNPTHPFVVPLGGNQFCNTPQNRLYFQELPPGDPSVQPGTPVGGNLCVNTRYEPINYTLQQINTNFQNSIRSYIAGKGLSSAPWLNYKLVNVQVIPFNRSEALPFNNTNFISPKLRSAFYQANITVETDYTLQQFNGRIHADNAPTTYPDGGNQQNFQNIYLRNPGNTSFTTYQMGGCMGCHGNAQLGGTDFSFIIGGNPLSLKPDTPEPESAFDARAFYTDRLSRLPSFKHP